MGGYQFDVSVFAGDEDIQWITRGGKHIPIKGGKIGGEGGGGKDWAGKIPKDTDIGQTKSSKHIIGKAEAALKAGHWDKEPKKKKWISDVLAAHKAGRQGSSDAADELLHIDPS